MCCLLNQCHQGFILPCFPAASAYLLAAILQSHFLFFWQRGKAKVWHLDCRRAGGRTCQHCECNHLNPPLRSLVPTVMDKDPQLQLRVFDLNCWWVFPLLYFCVCVFKAGEGWLWSAWLLAKVQSCFLIKKLLSLLGYGKHILHLFVSLFAERKWWRSRGWGCFYVNKTGYW